MDLQVKFTNWGSVNWERHGYGVKTVLGSELADTLYMASGWGMLSPEVSPGPLQEAADATPGVQIVSGPGTTLAARGNWGLFHVVGSTNKLPVVGGAELADLEGVIAACTWRNPGADEIFGVILVGQPQVFGIGAAPYWLQVTDDTVGSTPLTGDRLTWVLRSTTIDVQCTASQSSLALDLSLS